MWVNSTGLMRLEQEIAMVAFLEKKREQIERRRLEEEQRQIEARMNSNGIRR